MSFKLTINAEEPKSPVSNGRSGSLTGRFRTANPRKPERMKIISAMSIFSSLSIKYNERKISRKGKISLVALKIIGIININIGVKIKIINIAEIDPYKVRIIASCAFPCFSI